MFRYLLCGFFTFSLINYSIAQKKYPNEASTGGKKISAAKPIDTQPGKNALALYNEGIKLKEGKKYAEALALFQKAILAQPDYGDALYQAGWCCNEKGKYNDAVPYLKKALEINKDYVSAMTELGYCDYALQNYNDALKQFNRALNISKTELSLYYSGLCYVGLKNKDEAMKKYNELKNMPSNYADKLKKMIEGL